MVAHRIGDLLDRGASLCLAAVAKAGGFAEQRLEGRFQPVGEIAGAHPGARDVALPRGEERIDLLGERQNIGWPGGAHAGDMPRAERDVTRAPIR